MRVKTPGSGASGAVSGSVWPSLAAAAVKRRFFMEYRNYMHAVEHDPPGTASWYGKACYNWSSGQDKSLTIYQETDWHNVRYAATSGAALGSYVPSWVNTAAPLGENHPDLNFLKTSADKRSVGNCEAAPEEQEVRVAASWLRAALPMLPSTIPPGATMAASRR